MTASFSTKDVSWASLIQPARTDSDGSFLRWIFENSALKYYFGVWSKFGPLLIFLPILLLKSRRSASCGNENCTVQPQCCWQSAEELANRPQAAPHPGLLLWPVLWQKIHFACDAWRQRGRQIKQIAQGSLGYNDPSPCTKSIFLMPQDLRSGTPPRARHLDAKCEVSRTSFWISASSSTELSEFDSQRSLSGQLPACVSVVLELLWVYTAHIVLRWDRPHLCFTGPLLAAGLCCTH